MITWLVGDNTFEIREALLAYERSFGSRAERFDASELTLASLPDILMGVTLFAPERLVVIQDITTNSALWEKLPDWLGRISDAIHVIFVDTKPDKRTVSYKALKQVADIHEFPAWTDRDETKAQQWVLDYATRHSIPLDKKLAGYLVRRVGLDQWRLSNSLETLRSLEAVNESIIAAVIPANLTENIFQLFETALEGKSREVKEMLSVLALQEDPYALFALVSSQATSLAAIAYADDSVQPSKDFAIHPYVASKLARQAKKLGKGRVGEILELCAQTDADLKRSRAEPWLLVERLLIAISQ